MQLQKQARKAARPVSDAEIQQNVAIWRRERDRRDQAINRRENSKRFNSICDRMPVWRLE